MVETTFLAGCNGTAEGTGAYAVSRYVLSTLQERAAFF